MHICLLALLAQASLVLGEIRRAEKLDCKERIASLAANSSTLWIVAQDTGNISQGKFKQQKPLVLDWSSANLIGQQVSTCGNQHSSDTWALTSPTDGNNLMHYNPIIQQWEKFEGLNEPWKQVVNSKSCLFGITAREGKLVVAKPNKKERRLQVRIISQISNLESIALAKDRLYFKKQNNNTIFYVNNPSVETNWKGETKHEIRSQKICKKIRANPDCTSIAIINSNDELRSYNGITGRWTDNTKFNDVPFSVTDVAVQSDDVLIVVNSAGNLMRIRTAPDQGLSQRIPDAPIPQVKRKSMFFPENESKKRKQKGKDFVISFMK